MSEWKDIEEFKESTFYLEANEDVNDFFMREKERELLLPLGNVWIMRIIRIRQNREN